MKKSDYKDCKIHNKRMLQIGADSFVCENCRNELWAAARQSEREQTVNKGKDSLMKDSD
jgi:hypothetical protein